MASQQYQNPEGTNTIVLDRLFQYISDLSKDSLPASEKPGLKKFVQENCDKFLENNRKCPVGMFVTGKTGAGKSTLLNMLVGEEIFEEGDSLEPCTADLKGHEFKVTDQNLNFLVWDCPGLQDGTDDEERYLEIITKECKDKADLMLYCIDISQPRSADEFPVHDSAVKKITQSLGPDIWKHAIVVLTFGNVAAQDLEDKGLSKSEIEKQFKKIVSNWQQKLQESLMKAEIDKKVAKSIHVAPAGFHRTRSLPGYDFWYTDLWSHVLLSTIGDEQTILIFCLLGADHGTKDPKDATDEDFEKLKQPIFMTDNMKKTLATLGTTGSAAVATGATVGATIGALLIGIPSFGPAAGVGLVLGGAIGAGAGLGVGVLIDQFRRHHARKSK